MNEITLRRMLAECALAEVHDLPPEDRARAYEIVAEMLTGNDATLARATAEAIRRANQQQGDFHKLLQEPPHTEPPTDGAGPSDGTGGGYKPLPGASTYAGPS